MKVFTRRVTARMLGVAALGWSALAGAQTVVVPSGEQPAPALPAAPPAVVSEPAGPVHLISRPNRSWLTTGLLTFGQSYVASMGIAATSRHRGDSNLWIPALGPWLDLGARPSCRSPADCGPETGIQVLLVADGVLQTFGAFHIFGAFMWPETVGVPIVTTASGASLSVSPSKMGREGYGLAGTGHF